MPPDDEELIQSEAKGLRAWAIRSARETPEAWLVTLAAALGTALKVWLDVTTFGTNDVSYWYSFTQYILANGTVTIYRDIPIYNHPPLVSSFLWLLGVLTLRAPRLFPFLLRLPAILADVGSTIILWKLAAYYLGPRRALRALALFALNPVLIMVSGFHGNTDPVFIFFILWGAYILVIRKNWTAAALCLGLALNIKIVPVIVIPAFFFWLPDWRRRLGFLSVVAFAGLAGFGYHLTVAFPSLWRNIFSYNAPHVLVRGSMIWANVQLAIWGLGRIFLAPGRVMPIVLSRWYSVFRRYDVLVLVVLVAIIKGRQSFADAGARDEFHRGRFLLEAIGGTFLAFLIITPGFGVQYLSWLVGPGIFLGLPGLLLYTAVGSWFLFRVYTFWSGGFPWYFANSNLRSDQLPWVGFTRSLDFLLWLILLGWASFLILRRFLAWLAAHQVKRRAVKPPMVQSSPGPFDPRGKKIAVFVIAYNASAKIQETLARIPKDVRAGIAELFVVDDCSPDETYEAALRYKELKAEHRMAVLRNDRNQGYGGNQKIGYQYALDRGYDIVVMLHADGQYAPEVMASLLQPLVDEQADMVLGSRLARGGRPLRGGMPLYKYLGNRILTGVENILAGMRLSEFHSGYRAYSCRALSGLPLTLNSNAWHFDTEILLEFHAAGLSIAEVPIPTYYGDEICHVNGILYALHCIRSVLSFRMTRWGLWRDVKFQPEAWKRYPYEIKVNDPFSSQSIAIEYAARHPFKGRLLEIGPGSGAMTAEFSKLGYEVTVVESDPRFAEMAGQHTRRVFCQDVEALDWSQLSSYDMVVLADILEHLRDPQKVLQHCVDHLAPGGRVVITLPNAAHWSVRLELVLGRFSYRPRGILDQSHLRFFTQGSAEVMIRSAGLRILERRATPVPLPLLVPACREESPLFFLHVLNHVFTQGWRSLLAYQWAFWCEAAPGVRSVIQGKQESGQG